MPDLDPHTGPAGQADAAAVCATVHPNREQAIAAARRLRSGGWLVPLLPVPTRPDAAGLRVVAVVYDPGTYESPGQVAYADRVTPPPVGRLATESG